MADAFDLVVLGGGSGGLAASIAAARRGARVAVLEPAELGGTCVNRGCVPKKAMWLAAGLAWQQSLARALGFTLAPPPDWTALVARRQAYIDNVRASYRKQLAALDITQVRSRGELLEPDLVQAGDQRLKARHVLIATGARASRPQVEGAELGIDSDGFFELRAAPKRVAIIGGGYIGVELAGILQALGSRVELLVRGRMLERFDPDLVAALQSDLAHRGIRVRNDCHVAGLQRDNQALNVLLDDAAPIAADCVLWATGRRPNSDGIGLQRLGVDCQESGHIRIDAHNATNVPGVFAVGDVSTDPALTPVAVLAGRVLAERLFGDADVAPVDRRYVPTVVFSLPPLASVGMSEKQARECHGDAVRVFEKQFRPMVRALADDPQRAFVKLVCAGPEQRVVGVHAMGEGFDEALQGFALAMRLGASRQDLESTIAIHPGMAEELLRVPEKLEP